MTSGSVLGLTAKLGLETDERQVDREVDSLKDKLSNAAEAEMEADLGTLKNSVVTAIEDASEEAKWAPDLDLGGGDTGSAFSDEQRGRLSDRVESLGYDAIGKGQMGGPGGGGQGDPGIGGELLAGMKGAGGKFLKVGLAGAVGYGILSKVGSMADSSPRMAKNLRMITKAIDLFARPFFDWIARWGEGEITSLLQMGANFNKIYAEEGLAVAIAKLPQMFFSRNGEAGLAGTVGRTLGGLGGMAAGAWGGAKAGGALGAGIGSIIPGIGTAAGGAAGAAIGGTAGGIAGLFAGAPIGETIVDLIKAAFKGAIDLGEWIFDGAIPLGKWLFDGAIMLGQWLFNGTITLGQWIWDGSVSLGKWIFGGDVPLGGWIFSGSVTLGGWIFNGSVSLGRWLFNGSIGLGQWLFNGAINLGEWIFSGSVGLGKWIFSGTVNIGEWMFSGAVDIGNFITGSIPSPNVTGEDGILDSVPGSDYVGDAVGAVGNVWASGGVISRPTDLGGGNIAGEAGAEVIAPFSKFMSAINAPDQRFGSMRGQTGQGSGAGGSDVDGEEVVNVLENIERKLDRLDPSVELKTDRKTLARESERGRSRYSNSRVVSK